MGAEDLPNDVDTLKKMVISLQKKAAVLEDELALARKQRYGSGSEKRSTEELMQGLLFNEETATCPPAEKTDVVTIESHTRKKPKRRPLPVAHVKAAGMKGNRQYG